MSATAPSLSTWDLDVYFPSLDSAEFKSSLKQVEEDIASLEILVGALERETKMGSVAGEFLSKLSDVVRRFELLNAFIYGKFTVDTRDELAQARISEIDQIAVPLVQIRTRFTAWVGTVDLSGVDFAAGPFAPYKFMLQRAQTRATHLMSAPEEALAAELSLSGSSAWSRLHDNVTSQIEVDIELDGQHQALPMSAIRTLAYDKNRRTRQLAYEAELAAWKQYETPIAAAMNSIKGEVNTLTRRRKWETALDEAVFENNIDRETLEAMMDAARDAFPDLRRYLRAKAKAHGIDKLEWYDLFAPVEGDSRNWSIQEACDFVADQFDAYSSKMGDFARRSYRERWTDFEPRAGKIDGAYCMGTRDDESRILMNFKPSFGSVKTLAHELGHAYHNICLSTRPMLVRDTPSTLAETASIFCETIVKNAALAHAEGPEKVALLDACLQGPLQTVVDISSRFQFEKAVFDGRRGRELSAAEFCELMLQAQKDTYGDALNSYHPYMWAVKPHYYSTHSFYNFPYMFGLLFALGLYNLFATDPDSFKDRYDDLLSSTGMADAAELGSRFGFSTRDKAFWKGSLDVLVKDVDEFEALVS